jgi:hypothetical protein
VFNRGAEKMKQTGVDCGEKYQNTSDNDLQEKLNRHANNFADPCSIECPVCGFDNIHIVNVSILTGPDDYQSDAISVSSLGNFGFIKDLRTYNRNRNLSVLTEFSCEAGHGWSEYLAFHKGFVYKTVTSDRGPLNASLDRM